MAKLEQGPVEPERDGVEPQEEVGAEESERKVAEMVENPKVSTVVGSAVTTI